MHDINVDIENSEETLNSAISTDEIIKMINKCNNGKASSPSDNICNEYIKSTKEILLPIYVKFFNCILNTGFFPKSWAEGFIIPIYKQKGPSTQPENYRPITILSCLGKLFTAVLNERLTE